MVAVAFDSFHAFRVRRFVAVVSESTAVHATVDANYGEVLGLCKLESWQCHKKKYLQKSTVILVNRESWTQRIFFHGPTHLMVN